MGFKTMKQSTAITRQDLQIYKSQRLTDTPDGGGMMTNVALQGIDNELFDPISDVDRTMGALDTRLIYPAVLRNDAEKLLGANVIVSQPPEAENASILIVPADHYGQERASIMERIEAYRVPTVENRMILLGTQLKGSRLVQVYQAVTASLPVVGQVLALRVIENDKPIYDFVRIERFSHSIETFEDANGAEFQKRVIKMITQQALERDFVGVERVSRVENVLPPARVLETQIADSAKYYGIKPLAEAITQDSASLKIPSIYEQLVPVSTIETAMADDWAQGRAMWIETAPKRVVFTGYRAINAGSQLFLETPVLPTSVEMDGWKDDGTGTLKSLNNEQTLSIDYVNGVISGWNGQIPRQISAIPAVQVRNYAYSDAIVIDDTNVGTAFSPPPLRPAPARGSVQVSYMVGREWYTLTDLGDYILRDETGVGRGAVTKNGSITINLPAQPDSGSKIVISWCPYQFYQTIDDKEAGQVIEPKTISTQMILPQNPKPNLKPRSIQLSWAGGRASDDGQGNLIGDISGRVNYATGDIMPNNLIASEIQFTAQQFSQNPVAKNVVVADGGDNITLVTGALQKGTLRLELITTLKTSSGYVVTEPVPQQPKQSILDRAGWQTMRVGGSPIADRTGN